MRGNAPSNKTESTATERVGFDSSAVRSRPFRQLLDRTLGTLSVDRAEGVWAALQTGRGQFPTRPIIAIGDLCFFVTSVPRERWHLVPPQVSIVLLVRSERDLALQPRIASLALHRLRVLDVRGWGHNGHAMGLLRDYFQALAGSMEPDFVRIAHYSADARVLWLEFGDGWRRALKWDEVAGVFGIRLSPVSARLGEWGGSVVVRDAAGSETDLAGDALRESFDPAEGDKAAARAREARQRTGARLRAAREAASLSQIEVSRLTGIPQESISRLENGHRDPRLDTLRRLAGAFGLSLSGLLEKLSDDTDPLG